MQTKSIVALFLATTMLAACTQPGQQGGVMNKQQGGTLLGAVGGGLLGNQIGKGKGNIVATIGGTLLGAYLGNQIGATMDAADMAAYNTASQRALETGQPGQPLPWYGQNASGSITPSGYYQNPQGQYCREYTQTIKVGGRTEQGHGTACRQPDGSWQIVQ